MWLILKTNKIVKYTKFFDMLKIDVDYLFNDLSCQL